MKVLLAVLCLLCISFSCMAQPSQYLLGDGDVVRISVYDHPDLLTTVRINSDGSFLFPLIGEVLVKGKDVSVVSELIAQRLADGYIINPQVSVFVEEFRSKNAIIMGQVEKPGMYELRGQTTLLELISKAGGLKKESGRTVMVKSGNNANSNVMTLDLKRLIEMGDTTINVSIHDKDNVFVTKSGSFFVTGEVKKPDAYNFEEGITVIKAITMAGGFSGLASKKNVRLVRVVDNEEQIFENVTMHFLVCPDDVLIVPESFF